MSGKQKIRILVTGEDEQLVKRTVRRVAGQFLGDSSRQFEEELYHYGMIGLIEAKRSYDKGRKIPFAAFAVHRIKGAMIDHLRKAAMVRLPQKKQELKKQLEEARHYLRSISAEDSEEHLAQHLGWSVTRVREVDQLQMSVVSLAPTERNDNAGPARDRDIVASGSGPEAGLLQRELAGVVQKCLERIGSSRDRLILVGRIMHERKLRELADCFECSIETVRLRQEQAMGTMKRCLESNGWDGDNLCEVAG